MNPIQLSLNTTQDTSCSLCGNKKITFCRSRSLEKHMDIASVRLPLTMCLHICWLQGLTFIGAVTPQSSTEHGGSCCWSCWAQHWEVAEQKGCTASSPPLVARPNFIAERAFETKNPAPSTQLKMEGVPTAENTSGISF